jgi:glycosyltransferase involved in cell wall biosynthesis
MYHILFYETYWYYNYAKLDRHPHAFHAFGVDTSVMRPVNLEKKYDVLFVGDITEHKRPLKILEKTGKKLCVGFKSKPELCQQLELGGVEIMDFIKYEELAILYNSSKSCFIPCVTHGGGERAVLEARACGVPVEICSDNPKLAELMTSQIYNSEYYAKQLYNGIHEYLNKL